MIPSSGEGELANSRVRPRPNLDESPRLSAEGSGAEPPPSPDDELSEREIAHRRLEGVRHLLAPGALFGVNDRASGRSFKDVIRPVMLVGPIPRLDLPPEVAIKQAVRVCSRTSHKDRAFTRPLTDGEALALIEKHGLVFTPAGFVPAFTKDGYFELFRRLSIPLERLDPANFLGWLPRPQVEIIIYKMAERPLALPYPPLRR
jgi:hypothetical protein